MGARHFFVLAMLLVPSFGRAQSPAAAAPTAPAASQGAPAVAAPAVAAPAELPAAYTYEANGRRDPFLGVSSGPAEPRTVLKRGEGAAAYAVGEISVRGVMQSRGLLVAMVQGPDKKTLIVHTGDKLADGVVKSVIPQGLVIVQNITDPLSTQKQREVRKMLRSLEETKE
jgi:Tfp pilus assembly protein PilP